MMTRTNTQEFFNKLLNGEQSRVTPQEEDSLFFDNTEDVPLPALEEVETTNHNRKNHKSARSFQQCFSSTGNVERRKNANRVE
uniref:Uncharacterized protein n=1 Tax=Megaselia scalaris TaxID=36166 RepID=T1GMR2_MEGSC